MVDNTLIACPACGKEVSKSARNCPSCGEQISKPKRGFFGKIIIWGFWIFNVLMIAWIWGGVSGNVEEMATMDGAEQAGAAIGTAIGGTILVFIWLIGAIILGIMALLTRPK